MSACFHCQKEIDPAAPVCPYCQARQPVVTPKTLARRRVTRLTSVISSLILLVSFFLPWFHPLTWPLFVGANDTMQQGLNTGISFSGWDLTQHQFLAHEFYSPQTLPGEFRLLWLLPLTALLLLGAEIARIWRPSAFSWLRFWAGLGICASVVSLLYLFLKLPELNLLKVFMQFTQNGEYGFWLACASLILATLLLFRHRKSADEFASSRRKALFAGLNYLALLGVGVAAGSFLLAEQRNAARAWSTRFFFKMSALVTFPQGKVLAWSPDSKALLARMGPGGAFDPRSDSELPMNWQQESGIQFALVQFGGMTAQAWSPDGRYVAMTAERQSQVYSLYSGSTEIGQENWKAFRNYTVAGTNNVQLRGLAWSPDGQRLAAGAQGIDPQGNALYVWETTSGKQLATYRLPLQMNADVYSVAWSPDGKTLAACGSARSGVIATNGSAQGFVVAWNVQSGQAFFQHLSQLSDTTIASLAWSPDGRYVAMTAERQSQVYSLYSGSTEIGQENWKAFRNYTVAGTNNVQLRGLAWSPDGQRLAAGAQGIDPQGNALYVWETTSGKQLATYRLPLQMNADVYSVAWSPDGKTLAACGSARSGVIATNGSAQGFVVAWNVQSGQAFFQHLSQLSDTTIASLAWSPDSRSLAFADGAFQAGFYSYRDLFPQPLSDVPVQVWDVAAHRLIHTYSGHILGINCVTWSPDGKRLAAGGDDETVQVWDTTSGQRLLLYQGTQDEFANRYRNAWVLDLAWSPDGKTVASLSATELRIWDAP